MIDGNKSGVAKLLEGKTILRISSTEQVLFEKNQNGTFHSDAGDNYAISKYLPESIVIEFTDGGQVLMRIGRENGFLHDGSGSANIYQEETIPFISVS